MKAWTPPSAARADAGETPWSGWSPSRSIRSVAPSLPLYPSALGGASGSRRPPGIGPRLESNEATAATRKLLFHASPGDERPDCGGVLTGSVSVSVQSIVEAGLTVQRHIHRQYPALWVDSDDDLDEEKAESCVGSREPEDDDYS
uniref:Uncharacterized protein n=1 Tax=Cryptomonas curvata TaxID=233186 RepID=A0A7S0MEP2_9CRYP